MSIFNSIAVTYNQTRAADFHIINTLVALLDLPSGKIVADVGAGTGNYSRALAERGYCVKAIEPSVAMLRQSRDIPNVEWFEAVAEYLPLEDESIDGVVSTFAIHHFTDLNIAFSEMARILSTGPIVILTFDPRVGRQTWIANYFPSVWDDAFRVFPPISDLANLLASTVGRNVDIIPFRLPHNLQDHFAAAGWKYPHRYLDASYRANMSPFRLANQDLIMQGVARLEEDLRTGKWEATYGDLLCLDEIDAGYRFMRARPKPH